MSVDTVDAVHGVDKVHGVHDKFRAILEKCTEKNDFRLLRLACNDSPEALDSYTGSLTALDTQSRMASHTESRMDPIDRAEFQKIARSFYTSHEKKFMELQKSLK